MRPDTLKALAAALLFVVLTMAAPAAAKKETIVYGFHDNFPPFSFMENGKPVGFEVDLLKEALRTSNYHLTARPMSWDSILVELGRGSLDLTSGMAVTPQRRQAFIFTRAASISLFTRIFQRTDQRIRSFKELTGARAAVKRDSLYQYDLERLGGMEIMLFDTQLGAMEALWSKNADVFCSADKVGYFYQKRDNLSGISATGPPLRMTSLHFAFRKGQEELRDTVDAGIQALKDSGQYERIYKKWFVRDLEQREVAKLIAFAKEGADKSYIPYNLTPQGAAVLTHSGRYYAAGLVENGLPQLNASALTVAVQRAASSGDTDIRAAVVVDAKGSVMVPTANERRLLFQFGRGIQVVTEPDPNEFVVLMITDLLPYPQEFTPFGAGF